jgi:hypothetical protein
MEPHLNSINNFNTTCTLLKVREILETQLSRLVTYQQLTAITNEELVESILAQGNHFIAFEVGKILNSKSNQFNKIFIDWALTKIQFEYVRMD